MGGRLVSCLAGLLVAAVAAAVGAGCGDDDSAAIPGMVAWSAARDLPGPQLAAWRSGGRIVLARPNGVVVRSLAGGGLGASASLFARAAWSPDGRRIAFEGRSGAGRHDVYVAGVDGGRSRRLTVDGASSHPVWSSDGVRVYYGRERDGATEIWSVRAVGSEPRRITAPGQGQADLPSSFAPNGASLAFTRLTDVPLGAGGRERDRHEVWVMRPDGSGQRRLAGSGRDPAFSPNGRRIAFASDRDGNGGLNYGDRVVVANELYVMDVDGRGVRRLTRTRGVNEVAPSWSPDGARVAYQAGRAFQNAEATAVVQANADGSCPRSVFPLSGSGALPWVAGPAWRPGRATRGGGHLRCG